MGIDTEPAGGLEPLKLLPKGRQRVMPGLVTIKTADLEHIDWYRRKFDEASRYTDINPLGIVPQ